MSRPVFSRRIAVAVVAVAAVPIALVAVSAGTSQAAATPTDGGGYTMASGASGKCIDVTAASTANSALLVQVACNAAAPTSSGRSPLPRQRPASTS